MVVRVLIPDTAKLLIRIFHRRSFYHNQNAGYVNINKYNKNIAKSMTKLIASATNPTVPFIISSNTLIQCSST